MSDPTHDEPGADRQLWMGGGLGAAGAYYGCTHTGCHKKVTPTVTDHDCCGRCTRGRACLSAALNG